MRKRNGAGRRAFLLGMATVAAVVTVPAITAAVPVKTKGPSPIQAQMPEMRRAIRCYNAAERRAHALYTETWTASVGPENPDGEAAQLDMAAFQRVAKENGYHGAFNNAHEWHRAKRAKLWRLIRSETHELQDIALKLRAWVDATNGDDYFDKDDHFRFMCRLAREAERIGKAVRS